MSSSTKATKAVKAIRTIRNKAKQSNMIAATLHDVRIAAFNSANAEIAYTEAAIAAHKAGATYDQLFFEFCIGRYARKQGIEFNAANETKAEAAWKAADKKAKNTMRRAFSRSIANTEIKPPESRGGRKTGAQVKHGPTKVAHGVKSTVAETIKAKPTTEQELQKAITTVRNAWTAMFSNAKQFDLSQDALHLIADITTQMVKLEKTIVSK